MFEKLIIKGFQAHKNLIICFSPYLTVITGVNNVGKSAVIRALRWICLNKKPNSDFTNWDSNKTIVKLEVDGHTITRKKVGNKHSYSLNSEVYKAFVTKVPDAITRIIQLSEVNIQRQHDSPFWFSLSPGQISKELNSIVNLHVIDRSLSNVVSEIRKANAVVEITQERLTQARRQRKELKWIVKVNERLSELEQRYTQINTTTNTINSLRSLVENVQRIEQYRDLTANALGEAQKLLKLAKSATETTKRLEKLKTDISSYERQEKDIWDLRKTLNNLKVKISKVKRCPVCQRPLNK